VLEVLASRQAADRGGVGWSAAPGPGAGAGLGGTGMVVCVSLRQVFYEYRDTKCTRRRPISRCRACQAGGGDRVLCLSVGATRGTYYPFLLSAWFWAGVCPAGLVGGQDTQPGSTRIPSPAVAVVAGER
jgi:hypothetical protein